MSGLLWFSVWFLPTLLIPKWLSQETLHSIYKAPIQRYSIFAAYRKDVFKKNLLKGVFPAPLVSKNPNISR
jgi:uncharacterized circularly permuted ATP-grasp superfamily protein